MANQGKVSVEVVADFSKFAAQFQRDLNKALRGINVDMSRLSKGISDSFQSGVDTAKKQFETLGTSSDKVSERIEKNHTSAISKIAAGWKAVSGVLAGMGKVTAISAIGIAAANSGVQLLSLVATLSKASGVLVGLPGAAGIGIAAFGALKVTTMGLGDAFSAVAEGDAKKIEKAMKGLSPATIAMINEFKNVLPALQSVRTATQEAFSSQVAGQITSLAGAYSGPLAAGLSAISAEYGRMAVSASQFFTQASTVSAVSAVLSATQGSLAGLGVAIQPVLAGFRDIALVALPTLQALAGDVGNVGVKFGAWLSTLASSGAAMQIFNSALDVIGELGQLLGNLVGILGAVFSAASGGTNALEMFVALTGQVEAFLRSAEGSGALTSLFSTIGTLAAGLSPVFGALLSAIGSLMPAISVVASSLVGGLQALIPALAPLAGLIAQVAIALAPILVIVGQIITVLLGPLISAFSSLATLITPFLVPLGNILLTVAQTLATILAPALSIVSQLFAQLAPFISQVATIISANLTTVMGPVATALGQLFGALGPLIPALMALVPPAVQLVIALLPLTQVLPALVTLVAQLLTPVIQLLSVFLQWVSINVLVPIISSLAQVLGVVVNAIVGAIKWVIGLKDSIAAVDFSALGGGVINTVISALTSLWGAVKMVGDVFVWLWANAIKPAIDGIGIAFTWLWANAIKPAIDGIAAAAMWLWTTIFSPVFSAIGTIIAGFIVVIQWLWNTLSPIFMAIGNLIFTVYSGVISVVFSLIQLSIQGLIAAFQFLWAIVSPIFTFLGSVIMALWTNYISPAFSAIGGAAMALWNGYIGPAFSAIGGAAMTLWGAIQSAASAIGSAFQWLWGVIQSIGAFIGSIFTWIGNAAMSLWNGFISVVVSAIVGAFNMLWSVIQSVGSGIASAWSWLSGVASSVWNAIVSAVRGAISGIQSTASGIANFVNSVSNNFQNIVNSIREKIGAAVNIVRELPGKILDAIGNIGSILFSSGQRIIQGLIDGVTSKVGAIKNAVSNIASSIKGFFPFSPAKEGPLSGAGDTMISGAKITDRLVTGMRSQAPALRQATADMAALASPKLGMTAFDMKPTGLAVGGESTSGTTVQFAPGAIVVNFSGVTPSEDEARMAGTAVGQGIGVELMRSRTATLVRGI
jgi:phage-related protein